MSIYSEIELFKAKKAIHEIAITNGVSEAEVKREMSIAIDSGYYNNDPAIRMLWDRSPFAKRKPTPEEFLLWCASQVEEKNHVI